MQVESSPERDLVSDLASGLSTVSVSQTRQTRFVFGSFENMANLQPESNSPLETYARVAIGQLEEHAKQSDEDRLSTRQDVHHLHDQVHDLTDAVSKINDMLAYSLHGVVPGPESVAEIHSALQTLESRQKAVKDYGMAWVAKVRPSWPSGALEDNDFLFAVTDYLKGSDSGVTGTPAAPVPSTGTPAAPVPSQKSTEAPVNLLAPANPLASVGKAASGSVSSRVTTASTAFPFTTAVLGRHVKIDLPRPDKFSTIAVDSDIRAWLLRMHEHLTIAGVEPNTWVVVASGYLDKSPRQLWEARKTQLIEQPEVLYSWDSFKEWCIASFSPHNHEKHAISKLEGLRQTGSVAEYMAQHNVLASQSNLPMQLRIHWWEKGLKDEICHMCRVDPLTHKEYSDIDKAQSAACACDAHLDYSASAAASRKNKHPSSTPSSAYAKVDKKAKFTSYLPSSSSAAKALPESQPLQWTSNTADQFSVPSTTGRLIEPLPTFFKEWIDAQHHSESTGKPHLPKDLCEFPRRKDPGRKGSTCCLFKGCQQKGHAWTVCPKLALAVAKNPLVRNS